MLPLNIRQHLSARVHCISHLHRQGNVIRRAIQTVGVITNSALLFVLTWNQSQTHYNGTRKEQLHTPITFHSCNRYKGSKKVNNIERQCTVNATFRSEKIFQNGWRIELCFEFSEMRRKKQIIRNGFNKLIYFARILHVP